MTNTPTPASALTVGNTIQLQGNPARVTSLTHALDPAYITIHYVLLDTTAQPNTGWITVLKTDLIEVSG